MKPVHFDIPFPLIKGKGGVMRLLSANLYRNAYFHTLNNAKTVYDKVLDPVLQNIKPFTHPVKIDFKFFFKKGIGGISTESVKERIKQIIESEDKKKPLSDSKIAEILQKEGIKIARRTVAKYREELGIPGAFERRERK